MKHVVIVRSHFLDLDQLNLQKSVIELWFIREVWGEVRVLRIVGSIPVNKVYILLLGWVSRRRATAFQLLLLLSVSTIAQNCSLVSNTGFGSRQATTDIIARVDPSFRASCHSRPSRCRESCLERSCLWEKRW